MKNERSIMFWIARGFAVILSVALMVYVGLRSLNFLQYTMPGNEMIYAYLGLGATSGAAVVWLLLLLFGECNNVQKGIAYVMGFVGLIGEFGLATMDSYLGASLRDGIVKFTEADMKTAILLAVGLASAQTLALIVVHLIDGTEFSVPKVNAPKFVASVESAKISPIVDRRPIPSPAPLGTNGNGNDKRTFNLDVPPVDLVNQPDRRGEVVVDGKAYFGVDPDFERVMLASGQPYQPCLIIVKDENRSLDPFSAEYRKVWEAVMGQTLPLAVGATKPS